MTALGIELNDAALIAADAGGIRYCEPGYAIEQDGALVTGAAAARYRRLQPRRICSRYWAEMSDDSLPQSVVGNASFADLVHAQLERMWLECGSGARSVYLAVPPCWSGEQLGLLLGIAEELKIPVAGLAPTALAGARREYPGRDVYYLEATLLSTSIQSVEQQGQASAGPAELIGGLGIAALERAAVDYIARRLLECSRFDPMQDASNEQLLFDRLPEWLRSLHQEETLDIDIQNKQWEFSAQLLATGLADAVQDCFEPVLQRLRAVLPGDRPVALLVHDSLRAFPGLVSLLSAATGAEVFILEPGAAARGVLARQQSFTSGFALAAGLPWDQEPLAGDGPAVGAAGGSQPTHLLYRSSAYRLGTNPLCVGANPPDGVFRIEVPQAAGISRHHFSIEAADGGFRLLDHSRYGTSLNGHRVEGSTMLRAGDVITIGQSATRLELIAEQPDGEG